MKRLDSDATGIRSDAQRLRHDPARRASLDARVHRYLDAPVALAAILFVLVAFIQINNTGGIALPWHRRFWRHGPPGILFWGIWAFLALEYLAKLMLAPDKGAYLRRHWRGAVVAALPFFGVLRLADIAIVAPLLGFLRGHSDHPHLAILRKRKLGRLLLVTALVILLAAVLEYILEKGASGGTITTFRQALWWAAATVTTVANQLYPVTTGGEVVAFLLMVYAVVVFAYLASSMASALIGGDAQQAAQQPNQPNQANQPNQGGQTSQTGQPSIPPAVEAPGPNRVDAGGYVALSQGELDTLRALLDRAQAARPPG